MAFSSPDAASIALRQFWLFFGLLVLPLKAATPGEVLLLINNNSSTSVSIGTDYALKRGIINIVQVQCQDSAASEDNETISLADYNRTIAKPVGAYLKAHTQINFIVLTKGIPIRIIGGITGESFGGRPAASVDSYLAAIDYPQLPGRVKVSFNDPSGFAKGSAWLNRYYDATVPFTHAQFGGYLVTRLDGYTQADAMALVTRALNAEAGLVGGPILFDVEPDFGLGEPFTQPSPIPNPHITREDPQSYWNADMEHAASLLQAKNVPTDLEVTRTFVGNQTNLQGYFSHGSNDDNFDQSAYDSLHFAPGAISDTAVSTSARSFFPQTYGQSMIADLIANGITGVGGYTDEPLQQTISSPTILCDRYTSGFSLAESFYAAAHVIGWTGIVIGDPLCTPYPSQPVVSSTIPINQRVRLQPSKSQSWVEASNSSTPLIADLIPPQNTELFMVVDQSPVYGTGYVSLQSQTSGLFVSVQTGKASLLVANSLTAGDSEVFYWKNNADGTIGLRSFSKKKWVSAGRDGISPLSAKTGSPGASETFAMSAWVDPVIAPPIGKTTSLQSVTNNLWVSAANQGDSLLIANRASPAQWESFTVIDESSVYGPGFVALKAHANGLFVSAKNSGVSSLIADQNTVGTSEVFYWQDNGDGTVNLQSYANGLWVSADNSGANSLIAEGPGPGSWETYNLLVW
ncbi:MAG TPA: TIGR03790 family protein [Rariglobus sp.]|jgi:uncharacterized protein (TIGR03790 family)|nr:TIGR03790 family protein [Rariglobus sp.]